MANMKQQQLPLDEEPEPKIRGAEPASSSGAKKAKSAAASGVSLAGTAEAGPADPGKERRMAKVAKEFAFEFEKTNHNQLCLYASTGKWHKIGGNSALIYVHRIAPRLDIKPPKLLNDSDYYSHFKTGVVAIKDVETFEKRLESLNIHCVEATELYRIYDLGYKLTSGELKRLANMELSRKERINQLVIPKNVYPDIYFHIMEIHKMIRTMVYKMPTVDQRPYGRPILQEIQQAAIDYRILSNGEISLEQGLNSLFLHSQQIFYRMHDLIELGIESPARRARLINLISELRRLIGAEVEKVKRANHKK